MRIHHLINDIYETLKQPGWFTPEAREEFSSSLAQRLEYEMKERTEKPTLRLSQMGPKCPKALWYSIHHPELAVELNPWTKNTFAYGHIVEVLALTQAKLAGHEVTGEQDAVTLDGVTGHRDCIIDGSLCDVKSCGKYLFRKFKDKTISETVIRDGREVPGANGDLFGYLDQLDGYVTASVGDPLLRNTDTAYILAVDKQLGHMCLYEHRIREERIRSRIKSYKSIVEADTPPECTCGTEPFGASGNRKLDTQASYSVYRHCCWPGLRTFIYKDEDGPRPVYLTKVVRTPNVLEVDRYGQTILRTS